jgi:hypothetical protein
VGSQAERQRRRSAAGASTASSGPLKRLVRRDGSHRAQKAIVLRVRADPEPHDDIDVDDAERAMTESHPSGIDRPRGVYMFEVEAGVVRIFLETAVCFTGPTLDVLW